MINLLLHRPIQIICSFILSLAILTNTAKADTLSDVTTLLANLTCDTHELASMVRGEWGQTCVTMPFSTLAIAMVLAPTAQAYITGMTRININDMKLFPMSDGTGNCSRTNRANPSNPTLSFGICANYLLIPVVAKATAAAAVNVTAAIINGDSVWTALQASLTLNPNDYNVMENDKSEGDWGIFVDVGAGEGGVVYLPWMITTQDDTICVSTIGLTGWLPVGCKYVAETQPVSRYSGFMNPGAEGGSDTYTQCTGAGSCYDDINRNSRAFLPISGPLVGCITEMLQKVLLNPAVCNLEAPSSTSPSVFFQFQQNMHNIVISCLSLYVILFGFKVVLAGGEMKQGDIIMKLLVLVLVSYFAVGINMGSGLDSDMGFDGMTQWVFPIMFQGASDLASWIMNASPSGLCQFSTSSYATGYEYLALWDALDCRVAHYIGLDEFGDSSSLFGSNGAGTAPSSSSNGFDLFNFTIPPYMFLLVPAIISGNLSLAMLAITYPVLVISVAAYTINAFVVCLISVVILGILAPLFVPMALFEFTKGYFDSWMKLLLSFVLQPMVVATFMITLFTVYDMGFYSTCQFASYTESQSYNGNPVSKQFFAINLDPSVYSTPADLSSCKGSLGYLLNGAFAVATAAASPVTTGIVVAGNGYANISQKYPILSVITDDVGLFFTSPTLAFQAVETLIMSLLTACFCLYLMYHLSEQISSFATDMVEGVSVGGMAIQPRAIMSKVQSAAQKLGDRANENKLAKMKGDKGRSGVGGGPSANEGSTKPSTQPAIAKPQSEEGAQSAVAEPQSGEGAQQAVAEPKDNKDGKGEQPAVVEPNKE